MLSTGAPINTLNTLNNSNTSNTSNILNNNQNLLISSTPISCWPALEPSLNRLLTLDIIPSDPAGPSLSSEDYLKLYTLVFEYCVGASDVKKGSASGRVMGLNVSGEELYRTIGKFLEITFNQWAQSLNQKVLKSLL